MNRAELEQMIHNEMMHRPSQFNSIKSAKKDEYQKSAATSGTAPNPLGNNNHDQINVVYDI